VADFLKKHYCYPFDLRDTRLRYTAESTGLSRFAVESPAQRWDVDLELLPGEDGVDGPTVQLHRALHGTRTPFFVEMPQYPELAAPAAPPVTTFTASYGGQSRVGRPESVDPLGVDVVAYPTRAVITWNPIPGFTGDDIYQIRFQPTGQAQPAWTGIGGKPEAEIGPLLPNTEYIVGVRQLVSGQARSRSVPTNIVFTTPATATEVVVTADAVIGRTCMVRATAGTIVLPRGWFFTFSGQTKVFQVARPLTVTTAAKRLDFYPTLTAPLVANALVDLAPRALMRWAPGGSFGIAYASQLALPSAEWEEAV